MNVNDFEDFANPAGAPEDVDSIPNADVPPQAGRMSVDPDGVTPDGFVTNRPCRRTQSLRPPDRHNPAR
jgi:hypothetical protein